MLTPPEISDAGWWRWRTWVLPDYPVPPDASVIKTRQTGKAVCHHHRIVRRGNRRIRNAISAKHQRLCGKTEQTRPIGVDRHASTVDC